MEEERVRDTAKKAVNGHLGVPPSAMRRYEQMERYNMESRRLKHAEIRILIAKNSYSKFS